MLTGYLQRDFFLGFGLLGFFFALEKTTGTAGFPDGLKKYLPVVISLRWSTKAALGSGRHVKKLLLFINYIWSVTYERCYGQGSGYHHFLIVVIWSTVFPQVTELLLSQKEVLFSSQIHALLFFILWKEAKDPHISGFSIVPSSKPITLWIFNAFILFMPISELAQC